MNTTVKYFMLNLTIMNLWYYKQPRIHLLSNIKRSYKIIKPFLLLPKKPFGSNEVRIRLLKLSWVISLRCLSSKNTSSRLSSLIPLFVSVTFLIDLTTLDKHTHTRPSEIREIIFHQTIYVIMAMEKCISIHISYSST